MNPAQTENIEAILNGLAERGVEYRLIDGEFRHCDNFCVLSENEETGLEVIRPSLTEYLRLTSGLCIACAGLPRQATKPNYPESFRAKYPPLQYAPAWCSACYDAGAWKPEGFE